MGAGFTPIDRGMRFLAPLVAAAVFGASSSLAATDPAEVLAGLHLQDRAVERVGFRLAVASADLCRNGGADAGFQVHTLEQYGPAYRPAAARLFGLGDAPGVMAVAPGSPAEAAGLREGDALLAVNALPTPALARMPRRSDFGRTAIVQKLVREALKAPAMQLSVLRGEDRLKLTLRPVPACPSLFQVLPDSQLKGEADGDYVQVSSELASLASSDDELAALLGHELAHNVLGHRQRLDALHVNRGLLADFGPNARAIRQTEREADRLAVYLLARAGYAPDKALGFWVRAQDAMRGPIRDPTHPSWAERLSLVRGEARRIQDAGVPAKDMPLPADLEAELPRR
jgi:Zn-dependent protease with chaperone function